MCCIDKKKGFGCFCVCLAVIACHLSAAAADSIQSRFKDNQKLTYRVSYNGIPSGHIEWEYLGQKTIDGQEANVLSVSSDTKILKFLNLTSQEKVFLHSVTHLPLLVERDILLFGNKELIEEHYNQEEGTVTIKRTPSAKEAEVLSQDTPIHNILALLYFFPKDVELKENEWMTFNLPTQKVKIKLLSERVLDLNGQDKQAYFLIGRGAKRFNLWLDKEKRIPLRLEFIFPLGKVSIVREE
jgi:hypothetical protein